MFKAAAVDKKYHVFQGSFCQGIVAAFSSRHLNNMSLVYGDTKDSLFHRRQFLDARGINYQHLVCAKQVHAGNVSYVGEKDKGRGALAYDTAIDNTDALITEKKNLPLAIFTADCLSIFLYDPKTPAIGLAHAGWRSTKEGIALRTVRLMQKRFDTEVKNLFVGFGPSIRSCCYEVKAEFMDNFAGSVIERDRRYYLDLAGENKRQLLNLGVGQENIFDSGICTYSQNRDFFSYRREGDSCGRIISVIMLR